MNDEEKPKYGPARCYRTPKKLPPPNFAPEHSRDAKWMGRDSKGDVVWQPWQVTGRVLERTEKISW